MVQVLLWNTLRPKSKFLFWAVITILGNVMTDLIIMGKPLCTLKELGFSQEDTIVFEDEELFLPRILVKHGLFKSTSTVKQINKQRQKLDKIPVPIWPYKISENEQNLWRTVGERPEMTPFKIGRKVFWLVVGEMGK